MAAPFGLPAAAAALDEAPWPLVLEAPLEAATEPPASVESAMGVELKL
jgi:hypothetical protein